MIDVQVSEYLIGICAKITLMTLVRPWLLYNLNVLSVRMTWVLRSLLPGLSCLEVPLSIGLRSRVRIFQGWLSRFPLLLELIVVLVRVEVFHFEVGLAVDAVQRLSLSSLVAAFFCDQSIFEELILVLLRVGALVHFKATDKLNVIAL